MFLSAVFLSLAVFPQPGRALDRQVLRGHVPAAVAKSEVQSVGRLDGSTRLNLAIGLPLRNRNALAALLQELYDPASPQYHHYLTAEQFAERFGPTEQDYQALIRFAQANGLRVSELHPNRVVLSVNGLASGIERAFQITLRLYPHPREARTFYAPAVEPSLQLEVPVLAIGGLDNYRVPRPRDLRPVPLDQANAAPKGGSGPGGNYRGNDFRAAYAPGVGLTGTGQAIGLLEFDGYYASDISAYETQSGIPSVPVEYVLVDGFNGVPTTGPYSGNGEVSLDIEMAIAMAPGVSKVIVYEASLNSNGDDLLSRMATQNAAKQLSCSWDFPATPTTDQIFRQFAAQGQSFFNASGDNGAYVGPIPAPDDDPYITIVGGTTLTTSGPGGSWVSEKVWNWNTAAGGSSGASGGGISTLYLIPSWQQGISMSANHGSTTSRNIPDVALIADGVWVTYGNGKSGPFGGTSCGAPLWAGFTALVNQQALAAGGSTVGFLNPALYAIGKGSQYSAAFHDIKTGNNYDPSSGAQFPAVAGYDLCTGWGTPAGLSLINALAGPPDALRVSPAAGFTASGATGGPFSVSAQTFSLTNAGAAALSWAVLNPAPWLDAAPTSGTLTPDSPQTNVTVALNGAAASLAAGVYSASITFTNQSSGAVQSRQFTVQIGQNLIANGDFETGDFSYWTLVGDSGYNYVGTKTGRHSRPAVVHSGTYGALLGQSGSLGSLSQTVATAPGMSYLLSLWMANPFTGDTPNQFHITWNAGTGAATNLFDSYDMPQVSWTNVQFLVTAAGTSTTLQFQFRNDPQYFGLDDISLVPFSVPALQFPVLAGSTVLFTWNAVPGLVYQVQYKTDLAQPTWNALGSPITATSSSQTASDPAGQAAQRFYRVVLAQ